MKGVLDLIVLNSPVAIQLHMWWGYLFAAVLGGLSIGLFQLQLVVKLLRFENILANRICTSGRCCIIYFKIVFTQRNRTEIPIFNQSLALCLSASGPFYFDRLKLHNFYSTLCRNSICYMWELTIQSDYEHFGEKFLLTYFLWSHTPLFGHTLQCIGSKMWPKSGVWDHKKFDSKNFSTVTNSNNAGSG